MKLRHLASLAALLGLCSPLARAQTDADLQAKFSVSLTFTTNVQEEGRYVDGGRAYAERARFVSARLGNRELLEFLIEDGVIPGPLKGWSIVARASSFDALSLRYRLYAVKKGQADVSLDDGEDSTFDLQPAYSINAYKERYIGYGNIGYFTGGGTMRSHVSGSFAAGAESVFLGGPVLMPYSHKVMTIGDAKTSVIVPGKVSVSTTGGATIDDPDLGEMSALITGKFVFSDHKITALPAADAAQ